MEGRERVKIFFFVWGGGGEVKPFLDYEEEGIEGRWPLARSAVLTGLLIVSGLDIVICNRNIPLYHIQFNYLS